MKKTLLAVFFSLFVFSSANAELGVNVGVSAQVGTMETSGQEKNSDGTSETSSPEEALFATAGYFIEKDLSFLPFGMDRFGKRIAIGYDNIAHDLDLGTQTNTRQPDLGAGGATVNARENTLNAEVSGFETWYATVHLTDWLYVKGGDVSVDVKTKYTRDGVVSTGYKDSHQLSGTMMGFGLQNTSDNGMFFRLEYNEYDIGGKTVVSTSTDSKFTAVLKDVSGSTGRISIGKAF